MLDKKFARPVSSAVLAAFLLGVSTGCTSIKSTWYGDDGCQTCEKTKQHLHGVPTTLDIPTHALVKVTRTRYGRIDPATASMTFYPELESKTVDVGWVISKEIFTVDFKRPASGTLAYDLKFTNQTITKIENSLDDKTIASVAGLIAQVLKTVPTVTGGAATAAIGDQNGGSGLVAFPEVIASELFALNEPKVHERIQAFVEIYVNQCGRQCGPCPFPGPPPACEGIPCHSCGAQRCGAIVR
jgi:hypothetical protein